MGTTGRIPAKFYDYIAVGKPILVFAEDGATADLARSLDDPIVLQPGDCARVEAHLKEMYEQFQRRAPSVRERNTEGMQGELTKLELTKKLVNLIN